MSSKGSHMVISEKKMSRTKVEPVDQWLAKEGYFRKATPRDPNCLFRSISEQVYHTQHYHLRVRKECVELMEEKRSLFEESIGTAVFNYYLKEMGCFTEYGGLNEIRAMSLCYKRDIIVFVGEKQICENVTNNGFKTAILLCQTESKQYEPVYPMSFIESAAYCQSIVYEVLYKNLFKMYDVKAVADKMLNTGGDTLRHDKFFQKGNLDIREQLIENLYKRVKNTTTDETQSDRNKKVVSNSSGSKKVNATDVGETQSDWKKAPIPYKVAKALASDHYRNIELDIWHELKREVKSAGWNRFGNSVLQEGGKCLIEISINDPERQDRNNNKSIRAIMDSSAGESSAKGDQKVKSGNIYLQGYIQKMSANKDTPVLVFIQDLGERQYVPYDALKPIPRKPKQKNWLPMNRSYSIAPDPSRRWKKPFNSFSRKRRPNDTKIAYINAINSDNSSANDVSRSSFENEEHVDELPEDHQKKQLSNSIEDCSTHTELVTSEQTSSSSAEVILNPQSTISNNAEQQKVPEEHKKKNNNARNKYEKSNSFGKSLKNSNMKTKALETNNCLSYENVQIPVNGNPNVPYIVPDGNMYSFCQYVPGKFNGSENQMDPSFHAWYKVHPVPMYEEAYRSVNPPYYGPLPSYGPGHNGVQHLPAPNVQNPYMQDEKHLVNAMQDCSLTCNEGMDTGAEASNVLPLNMNSAQNGTRPPNQGPKNNANELPQTPQKGKQTINGKANNRMRARHNNTRRVYNNTQFINQAASPGPSAGTYDTPRRPNMQVMSSPQRYWDPCFPQSPMSAGPMNAYGSPQYTSPNVLPPMPYEYSPQNEGNLGNPPVYYAGNGSYAPHFVSPHMDESLHYQHVSESYPPSYSQTGGQPVAYAPMMYQQLMHFLQTPPPQMQDQWNQMMGTSYVPCAALSPTHAEPPSNGPGPVTH